MKEPYSGQPGTDWHLSKEFSSFEGTPLDCQGELRFVNQSDAKVKIRTLQTEVPSRTRKECKALKPSEVSVSVRLPPHSEASVLASLQLPPDTPPGLYQSVLVYGKQKLPIEINVKEHFELQIDPGHISARANAGDAIHGKITLTNSGNTRIDLSDVGMVWLREQNWIGRTLVYSLRESSAEENYEAFANRVLHDFQNQMLPAARIVFDTDKPTAIDAGQRITRSFTLTAPPGMKKGRRYLGFIKINENRIWLEVFCTGSAKELA